jgi:hypothetical protein
MAEGSRMIRSVMLAGVMTFCVFVIDLIAQSTDVPKTNGCPVIGVTGPAGITNPGNLAWFEVSIAPDTFPNLIFDWKVDGGNVDEGQATKKIGVRYTMDMQGTTVTASVEIKGLPDGCPYSASESVPLIICSLAVLLDEFSVPINSIDTERLKIAATNLSTYTNDQMYIVEYFPTRTRKQVVDRKLNLLRNHLVRSLKFDPSRVTIVAAASDDDRLRTRIYRIPPGAPNPSP